MKKRPPRKGEEIGGGWFVCRRGTRTGRLRFATFPFEHPTADAALEEARRLSALNPGKTYVLLQQLSGTYSTAVPPLVPEAIDV